MKVTSKKNYFNCTELAIVVFIMSIGGILLAGCLAPMSIFKDSKAKQISCASNLKQIGLAFAMYSLDYDDKMPRATAPGDNVDPVAKLLKEYGKGLNKDYFVGSKLAGTSAGNFEELRLSGLIKDAKVYKCPSTVGEAGSKDKALNDDTSSYAYAFGMIAGTSSVNGMPDSGIVADGVNINSDGTFVSNHEGYGNILYLDSSVRGFKGSKWYKNSGMWQKKVPTRKLQSTTEMF